MKRPAFVLLPGLILTPTLAGGTDGNTLAKQCAAAKWDQPAYVGDDLDNLRVGDTTLMNQALILTYVDGCLAGIVVGGGIVATQQGLADEVSRVTTLAPRGVDAEETTKVFCKYLRENPNVHDEEGCRLLVTAAREAWPN